MSKTVIAERSPAAAAAVATRIDRTVQATAQFPNGGRLDEETGAREWVVPGLPLFIIYVVGTDLVAWHRYIEDARELSPLRRVGPLWPWRLRYNCSV